MSKVCSNFYDKLYTQSRGTEEVKENRRRALNGLGNMVIQEINTIIGEELIEKELHAVAIPKAQKKTLGPDGVLIEFLNQILGHYGHKLFQVS